jgi:hypothetical protein
MNKLFSFLLIGLLSIGMCSVYAADDVDVNMSNYQGEIINQVEGSNINLFFGNETFAHVSGCQIMTNGLWNDEFDFHYRDHYHTIVMICKKQNELFNQYQIAVNSFNNPDWPNDPKVFVKLHIIK